MKGRKPTPSVVLKLLGGTKHSHRPPRTGEPKPKSVIPICPKHLDKEAQDEWRRMAKELEPLGILTKLDKAIFAVYCESFSTWAYATGKIQELGMIRVLKSGYMEQNGYIPIANKAKEQMMKALIEMGMTPSSRTRVKVSKEKEQSAEEEFLNSGRK